MNIQEIATETNSQPYEIAALLDLSTDWTDTTELTAEDLRIIRYNTTRVAEEQA